MYDNLFITYHILYGFQSSVILKAFGRETKSTMKGTNTENPEILDRWN